MPAENGSDVEGCTRPEKMIEKDRDDIVVNGAGEGSETGGDGKVTGMDEGSTVMQNGKDMEMEVVNVESGATASDGEMVSEETLKENGESVQEKQPDESVREEGGSCGALTNEDDQVKENSNIEGQISDICDDKSNSETIHMEEGSGVADEEEKSTASLTVESTDAGSSVEEKNTSIGSGTKASEDESVSKSIGVEETGGKNDLEGASSLSDKENQMEVEDNVETTNDQEQNKTSDEGKESIEVSNVDEGKNTDDVSTDEPTSVAEKKNDKEADSDSDDGRPQIFLRNFAEITERDSDDDEDDVQEIHPSRKTGEAPLKVKVRNLAAERLAEISTTDDSLCDLDLVAEVQSMNPTAPRRRRRDRREPVSCQKLTKWLIRASAKPNTTSTTRKEDNTITRSPVLLRAPQLSTGSSRDSSSFVLNNMLQSARDAFPIPNHSGPRGTMASNTRTRQPATHMAVITFSGPSFSTGSNPIGRQITSAWSPNRQPNPGIDVRNVTAVTNANTLPRPAVAVSNNNVVNVQQQFAQLIFDPNSGLLLCPTSQNCQVLPQQTSQPQLQPHGVPQNTQLRLQNGMIIRPSDPQYNAIRQVVDARNGLEISLNAGPSVQQRMVQAARPTAPIRPFIPSAPQPSRAPVQPSRYPYRPQRPNNIPPPHQQQQARPRAPIPGPRATPVRYPPIRPTNAMRPLRPNSPVQSSPVTQVIRHNGPPIPVAHQIKTPGSTAVTPEASNVTAGNQKPIPGTVDDSDSDLQNKTFPSLVVQVKTGISPKADKQQLTKARSELDANVKGVLVLTPSKFTEWLMRRGLLRLSHNCDTHPNNAFKLGMYSDSARQPFSGGYVWTSDCCPDKQISVFNGSIFEGSKYPPGTVLKLIYHWACQTPANNILQWVKVSSLYLKNFYTLVRAVCIAWMHECCPPMGGEGKYVQLGVITLGSSAETSRGLKNVAVEILGVFDPSTNVIRLKVINSMQGVLKEKGKAGKDSLEQGARAFQILWALTHWVDKRSILVVDGMIDRSLFHEIGFRNIHKCDDGKATTSSNAVVMNYLRNLVPKMFSSTLSVLSKSIVQQFLDELSWREMYGNTVLNGFNNLLDHISALTKWDFQEETLISRLNKINQNPFVDWSNTKQIRRCPLNTIPLNLRNEPGIRECVRYVMKEDKRQPPPPVYNPNPVAVSRVGPATSTYASQVQKPSQKRKNTDVQDVVASIGYYKEVYESSPKVLSLQIYYYGTVRGEEMGQVQPFTAGIKCPLCIRTFNTNTEIMRHLFIHIGAATYRGTETSICRICLKELPVGVLLNSHIQLAHVMTAYAAACRICQEKFKTEQELVIHMWDQHQRRETPYKCRRCGYASSFHCHLMQHYQDKHAMDSDTVCPFCLRLFSCNSVHQLKTIISHLQAHTQLLRRVKKCPRCVLTFVSDVDLELHLPDHHSQEPSAKWIPYIVASNETNIKMANPPPTKSPLSQTMMAVTAASSAGTPPPASKKPKLSSDKPPKKKEKSTLNATLAVPIDTNEKFGGTTFKISVVTELTDLTCSECREDILKANHFIGKLFCSKCRYTTSCQAAMELHHTNNHSSDTNKRKPGLIVRNVKLLDEEMTCICGYSSFNPFSLATHLTTCDKLTVYPKRAALPPPAPTGSDVSLVDTPETSMSSCPPTVPDPPCSMAPLSPTLGLLSNPPTTFDDMLQLEESMATTLDALNLPSLLSPSSTIPQSPPGLFPTAEVASNNSSNPPTSQPPALNNSANTDTSNTWDTDWELPMSSLIAKCT